MAGHRAHFDELVDMLRFLLCVIEFACSGFGKERRKLSGRRVIDFRAKA